MQKGHREVSIVLRGIDWVSSSGQAWCQRMRNDLKRPVPVRVELVYLRKISSLRPSMCFVCRKPQARRRQVSQIWVFIVQFNKKLHFPAKNYQPVLMFVVATNSFRHRKSSKKSKKDRQSGSLEDDIARQNELRAQLGMAPLKQ